MADFIPGINVGNIFRQMGDWGGDYDIFDNASFDGGVRDKGTAATIKDGKYVPAQQGAAKPGYDATGRKVSGGGENTQTGGANDPIPSGGGAGAGAGGAAGPVRDLAAEGFYQSGIDQTQNLINTLPGREQTALQALIESFMRGRERQDVSLRDNESDYIKTSDKLVRENANRKSQIDNNVRGNITALQRLLGSRGAGSSSASQLVVPQAAAAEGTSQRAEATQTFVDNKDATDTNWKRYKREWDQAKLDSEADLENNKRDVQGQFAEQGIAARQKLQELQTNLASARGGDRAAINAATALTSQINDLQNKIASLAARTQSRVIRADDPAYKAAETKAMSDATTSTAQNAEQDPNYDATAAYYGDTKELSDEELLKQLYGTA